MQKMTLYELKTLLIKYENEQLLLLGVAGSLPKNVDLLSDLSEEIYKETIKRLDEETVEDGFKAGINACLITLLNKVGR